MVDGVARLEVQFKDANSALFHVLTECCQLVLEADGELKLPPTAVTYAGNIRASGKTQMPNKQIAECAYMLSAHMRAASGQQADIIKRLLAHLMTADRWESKL